MRIKNTILAALACIAAGGTSHAAETVVYENNFRTYDDFAACKILDKNNDGICWEWDSMNGSGFAFCYGTDINEDMYMQTAANDWIVTPEIPLLKGHSYRMSVNTQLLYDPEEKFECKWGTDYHVEDLTNPAIQPTVMDESFASAKTVDGNRIDVIADGNYRFGFHMMSDAYSDGLALHSIKVVDLGLTSELGNEPVLVFSEKFESLASFTPFTVIDLNGDSNVWSYNSTKGCAMYTYSSKNAADDHLVTPAIPMQVGRNYQLKFKAEADSEVEKIEVLMGRTNKHGDLTQTLVAPVTINKRQSLTLGNDLFKVDATGDWYVSFHAISDPDKFKLYVDDIEIWDIGPNGETEDPGQEPEDKALPIPYDVDMSDPAEFANYTVYDANYDGATWRYDAIVNTTFYGYSKENKANDWLISPDIKFEAGKNYRVIVTMASRGIEYPERFEVKLGHGKDISTYTRTMIEPTVINMNVGDPVLQFYGKPVAVEETGTWNVGIHAISDADMSDILLYRVRIEEVNLAAPTAVTDLTAEPDKTGKLAVTVQYKAPTANYAGETLSQPLTKIELYRGETLIDLQENVAPGSQIKVEDTGAGIVEGMNQYSVVPYIGENDGEIAQVNVYVGCDVPKKLTGVKGTDLGTSIKLEWNAPSNKGTHGGLVYPDLVSYNIYELETETMMGFEYIVGQTLVATSDELSCEVSVPLMNLGSHRMVHYAVAPFSNAGEGDIAIVNFLAGRPYLMPFEEHFSAKGPTTYTQFDTDNQEEESGIYAVAQSSDGDGYALEFVSVEPSTFWAMFMGKVNVADAASPVLTFDACNYVGRNTVKVLVMTPDNVQHEVGSFVPKANSSEYESFEVDLSDYAGNIWIRPIFAVEYPYAVDYDGNSLRIDNISLHEGDSGVGAVAGDSIQPITFPCDVYSVDGRLLRKNATSLEGLNGIVIVNGHKLLVR